MILHLFFIGPKMNKNKVYTEVSLFSGSGGLDIGLEQAGLHTVWANDFTMMPARPIGCGAMLRW